MTVGHEPALEDVADSSVGTTLGVIVMQVFYSPVLHISTVH